MKRRIASIILALVMVFSLCAMTGCSKKEEKIKITIALYDRIMFKGLSVFLEEKFPEYEITFIETCGNDGREYFEDMVSRGQQLPDIITINRFSQKDASGLAPYLMDVSQTEVAATFYANYLESYKEKDGAIRWLPMAAVVDGIMANTALFEQYNIPMPTNYEEFIAAHKAFEEQGIIGFQPDYSYDYTSLDILQGCAITELMTYDAMNWRLDYENTAEGEQIGLDEQVWMPVFEKYGRLLSDLGVQPEAADYGWNGSPYLENKIAMIRATGAIAEIATSLDVPSVMLPYFGETAEESWIFTNPTCYVAVSKQVEENDAKKEAVLNIMDAIFSQEGQQAAEFGTAVISYNKNINITTTDRFQYVEDCIKSNRMYVPVSSAEFFRISQDVTHKMIRGEEDARAAYEDFNAQLTAPVQEAAEEEVLFVQKDAYSLEFGKHGIPAASSLINTIRTAYEDDIAIGFTSVASSPIYAGDYTERQVGWVQTYKAETKCFTFTGSEIEAIMEHLVNVKEDGSNPVRHRTYLPVTSGMEYTVTETERGKFTLGDITVNGKPLEADKDYSVMLIGADTVLEDVAFCNCPWPEDLKLIREERFVEVPTTVEGSNAVLRTALETTQQFLAPTDYVTIKKK